MDLYQKIYTEVTEGVEHDDLGDDCPRCSRTVTDADPGVKCDSCQRWHHAVCEGISPEEYGRMMSESPGRQWNCLDCSIIPDTGAGGSQPHVQLKWDNFYRSGSDVLKFSSETVKAHLYKSFSQELEAWVRPDTFEILSKISERFANLLKSDSLKELVKQGVFKFEKEGSFDLETTAADANVVTASSDPGGTTTSAPKPQTGLPYTPPTPHETSADTVAAASRIGERNYFEIWISSSFLYYGF